MKKILPAAIILVLFLYGLGSCKTNVKKGISSHNSQGTIAPTPPMGWNSFDAYDCRINEAQFKEIVDYMAGNLLSYGWNYAVIDYASRHRTELLYNFYRMGMNSIERGSNDYWTVTPKVIDAVKAAYAADRKDTTSRPARVETGSFRVPSFIPSKYYEQVMKDPARRDPRAYIIPSDQADFPTAVKFVNALIGSGIKIQKASDEFTFNGKKYPAGSYVVKTAQAFRPYIIDLFEPQDHPNDLQYPGGPPIPPYDAAGWTLAFQMGIKFDRTSDNIDAPLSDIPYGEIQSYAIKVYPPVCKSFQSIRIFQSDHKNN